MLSRLNPFCFLRRFLREDRGSFAVEFGLLLVPVILLGALSTEQLLNYLQRNEVYNQLKEDSRRFFLWRDECPNAVEFRDEMCENFAFISESDCRENVRVKVVALPDPTFEDADLAENPTWENDIEQFEAGDYLVMSYYYQKETLFKGFLPENNDGESIHRQTLVTRVSGLAGCS